MKKENWSLGDGITQYAYRVLQFKLRRDAPPSTYSRRTEPLFVPHIVASVLQIPSLEEQSANYFRLVGLLVGGLGILYIVSGRLNARGFVFASMLDRPLVPLAMAILWYLEIVPGPLALIFSIQDFAGFLWTLMAWRAEQQARGTN